MIHRFSCLQISAKNRTGDAERALRWLRGWVPASNVREELQLVVKTVQHPPHEEDQQHESPWSPFSRRTFFIPLMLVSLVFFLAAFGGSATLQTFAVYIFDEVDAPMNKYTATVILGVAELLGTATCVASIHFVGKRRLNWVSISGTGLCFLGSAIYVFLLEYSQIEAGGHRWIPTTLLIGSAFVSHMGIRQLAWILAAEVFPAKVRIDGFADYFVKMFREGVQRSGKSVKPGNFRENLREREKSGNFVSFPKFGMHCAY